MSNLEKIKIELEILKTELQAINNRLLLFTTATGGSFLTIIKSSYPLIVEGILYIATAFSFIGVLINLNKSGKIIKEISELKKRLNNG